MDIIDPNNYQLFKRNKSTHIETNLNEYQEMLLRKTLKSH